MRLVVVLLVLLGVIAFAACGGGGTKTPLTDEQAIEKLFRDYAKAFDNLDKKKLMTFYSKTCPQLDQRVEKAVQEWKPFHDTVDFEITGVQVANVGPDVAEAKPEGRTIYPGQVGVLTVQDVQRLVKEDGKWKFADCNFTF